MNRYFQMPPVVKNLIIINVLVFLAMALLPTLRVFIDQYCALWVGMPFFRTYQFVTYMFLHASFEHLFFNMFALWMFGRTLEYRLGARRFFAYYMICGMGAALLQMGVGYLEYSHAESAIGLSAAFGLLRVPTVGASGAVFGLLLAFGVLYPNQIIMLVFPPVAMKAKWFVLIYGLVELFFGLSGYQSGVAHFAHLGGMLWGWLLLCWWKRTGKIYY